MKTTQVISEEIDALRFEAKGIFEAAKQASRELNADEQARFDAITNKKDGEIAVLKKQWDEADAREKAIVEISTRENREKALAEIDSEITNQAPSRAREVLTTDHSRRPAVNDRIFVKTSKLKAFKDERAAFNSGMWLRSIVARSYGRQDQQAELHCHRNGLDISNSSYEGSGTAGGYLVPPQMASTIIEVREEVGIARRVAMIQPMTSDMLSIAKRSGGLTVYYPNELGTITDSDKSWQQVALAAVKRAVACKISQELVEDALISIVDNVVTEMSYALALQEDNELLNGTGASTYGGVYGLRSAVGSAGTYTCDANENLWSEVDIEDVVLWMAKLPQRFARNPSIICSENFYMSVLFRLMAAAGGNNINSLQAGDGGARQFFGKPVYVTSQMPLVDADSTIHALYGTFDMAVILGDRTGIRIARDDSTGFLADYTTLKATARYDIKVHEGGDSSNAGAYVAFKTNSA